MNTNENESTDFYFKKLWKYFCKFPILDKFKNLIPSDKSFMILLTFIIGHFVRLKSINKIFESKKMKKLSSKLFDSVFDVDTARRHLIKIGEVVDINEIMKLFLRELSKRKILQRECIYICKNNKKLIPIGIDGTECFRTYSKSKINQIENETFTGYTKSDHDGYKRLFAKHCFCSLCTLCGIKLILGFDVMGKQESFKSKDESEKILAGRLIKFIKNSTKINNFILVGDAMYTDTNRMKESAGNDLFFLFTLKDNLSNLIKAHQELIQLLDIQPKKYRIRIGRNVHNVEIRKTIITYKIKNIPLYVYEFYDLDTRGKEMAVSNIDLPLYDAFYLKHIRWEHENTFNMLTKQYNFTHNFILKARVLTTLIQILVYNIEILYINHYLNKSIILNGENNFSETIDNIKDSLFNMKVPKILLETVP